MQLTFGWNGRLAPIFQAWTELKDLLLTIDEVFGLLDKVQHVCEDPSFVLLEETVRYELGTYQQQNPEWIMPEITWVRKARITLA